MVNHFLSGWRWLQPLERWVTPLSMWVGFRLDVPVEAVTRVPGLTLVREQRVNVLGLWRLLELRRV